MYRIYAVSNMIENLTTKNLLKEEERILIDSKNIQATNTTKAEKNSLITKNSIDDVIKNLNKEFEENFYEIHPELRPIITTTKIYPLIETTSDPIVRYRVFEKIIQQKILSRNMSKTNISETINTSTEINNNKAIENVNNLKDTLVTNSKSKSYESLAFIGEQRKREVSISVDSMEEDTEYFHAEVARLTMDQRKLLQESYYNVLENNEVKHGTSIMLRLFSEYPHYKNIWPQFRAVPDSSLMFAPQLKKHACVYMGGIRLIINCLENDEKLIKALRKIAKAHVKWNIYKYHIMVTF